MTATKTIRRVLRQRRTALRLAIELLEERSLMDGSAVFLLADPLTGGTWKGTYGGGYMLAQDPSPNNPSLPSYARVGLSGQSNLTWSSSTTDTRALQKAAVGSTSRMAASWYASKQYSIDVRLTDGQPHQVALYMLDWDRRGRVSKVQAVSDTGTLLDSRTVSGFGGGTYLVWSMQGNVTLRVTKANGPNVVASGLFFDAVRPSYGPPTTTIAGAPTTALEGSPITLTASASDPDPDAANHGFTYAWTVTKGGAPYATGSGPSFAFTPDDNATYAASVTVTDYRGLTSAPANATIAVTDVAPMAALTGAPATSPEETTIALTTSATDPSPVDVAAGFAYAWAVNKDGAPYATGSGPSFAFTPDDNGSYVVSVTAADKDGAAGPPATATIAVTDVAPAARIAGDYSALVAGSPAAFQGSATDPSPVDTTAGFTYAWDFGDGTQGSGPNPNHTYGAAGTYTVTFTATDKDGSSGTTSTTAVVAAPGIFRLFDFGWWGPVAPGAIPINLDMYSPARGYGWTTFIGWGSETGGPDPLLSGWDAGGDYTFRVDLPNGTYDITAYMGDYTGFSSDHVWYGGQSIATAFTAPGQFFEPTFHATVSDGQLSVRFTNDGNYYGFKLNGLQIVGQASPPSLSAGPNQSSNEGDTVTFQGQGLAGLGWTYAWDFGDGTTTTGSLSPQHRYLDNGAYLVTLTATDSAGGTQQATATVTVDNLPPTAHVPAGPFGATIGDPFGIAATVTDPGPVDTAAGFLCTWDFGDGTAPISGQGLLATTHTYATAGTYVVRVTAADKDGGQGSATTTVRVVVGLSNDPNDPINKPVMSQSNFTYLGSFRMPESANGWSTAYSMGGLTYRYVDGQLRFLTTSHVYSGGLVYETNYPGIGTGNSIPLAQVMRNWGDVYTGQKWVGNDGGSSDLSSGVWTYGLNYDQALGRLYWSYGHWYNASNPYNPSLGYSTLNDATGVATGVGAWSLADRPEKFDRGGTLRIPQWFADRYTDGKSLGVGFGGYFSIIGSGSLGPTLAAVGDPDPDLNPNRSALANVPLVGYPIGAPDRGHRDTDYNSFYDGGVYPTTPGQWNSSNGVGYWTWSDVIYGGATWIDLPGLGGVLYIARVGRGNVWYEGSTLHADRGAFEWMVYDPKDLAKVATGALEQWQVQPKYEWVTDTLPLGPLDQSGWSGDGTSQVGGVTFDPSTNRLFVLVNSVWPDGVEWYPEVYVYQVGAPGRASVGGIEVGKVGIDTQPTVSASPSSAPIPMVTSVDSTGSVATPEGPARAFMTGNILTRARRGRIAVGVAQRDVPTSRF
jgi:PKD repeat protein